MEYIESEWEYLQNPKEFSNVRSTNVNVDIENILIQRENQYKIVMQLTVENLTKKDMKKLRKLSTFIFKDKFILHRIECSFKTTQDFGKSYPNKRILIYNVYRAL